ncbi:hypothetical protein [Nostoc linckia]|nr:hypothetical protein [Nostoc linckia]
MSRTDSPAKRDHTWIASRSESKSDVQHIYTQQLRAFEMNQAFGFRAFTSSAAVTVLFSSLCRRQLPLTALP